MSKAQGPSEGLYNFHFVKWFPYLIGLLMAARLGFYAYSQVDLAGTTFLVQGFCFLLSLIWLISISWHVFPLLLQFKFSQIKIHPAWLFVLIAIILRYHASSFLPPVNQTVFEEVQTGSIAHKILLGLGLPIEFRFTNLLAALGLRISSGSLYYLRFPFQIFGLVGLISIVYCLQSLGVGWIPTLLIVFMAATMRFLVIASGLADELFASIPILTVFLLCAIKSENAKSSQSFWLAAAGIFGGILMFEYTSYRLPVAVFGVWLLWKCFYQDKPGQESIKSSGWANLFAFVIPLILVALPTLVQMIRFPDSAVFFESFHRHEIERSSILSATYLLQLKNQTLAMIGWPLLPAYSWYAPVGEPVVLPLIGWLFGISCLFSMFFMGRGIPRVLAVTVFLALITSSLFANDVVIGRMAPTFPILLILSGVFLEKVCQFLSRWIKIFQPGKGIFPLPPNDGLAEREALHGHEMAGVNKIEGEGVLAEDDGPINNAQRLGRFTIKVLASALFLALISEITLANLHSLKEMAENQKVIDEYVNDDYSVCSYIGVAAKPNQRVYIYSPGGFDICTPDPAEGWYYADKQLEILHSFEEPKVDDLVPGELVVMGVDNRELTTDEVSWLIRFGAATNSLASLQFSKNYAGRTTVASICFQCKTSNE